MKEGTPNFPEDEEAIRDDFHEFMADAQVGTPKLSALWDFIELEEARRRIESDPQAFELKNSEVGKKSSQDTHYLQAFQRIQEFKDRFEECFKQGPTILAWSPVDRAYGELHFVGHNLTRWGTTHATLENAYQVWHESIDAASGKRKPN